MLFHVYTLLTRFLLEMMEETRHMLAYRLLEGEIRSMNDVVDPVEPEMGVMEDVTSGVYEIVAGIPDGTDSRCYRPYGCYAIGPPWSSPTRRPALFPQKPGEIRTSFCLYTRRRPRVCKDMRDAFLAHEDVNVMILSWFKGAGPPYSQAMANIRLIGDIAGQLLHFLGKETGFKMEDVHIVGFSLGAHLASYIGTSVKRMGGKVGRITGLDPAGVDFEGEDPEVRLDPGDAEFVDVIHTDGGPYRYSNGGLGQGLMEPLGHLDFYPNSGLEMPGCNHASINDVVVQQNISISRAVMYVTACNHLRSIDYFLESMKSDCQFLAFSCADWDEFKMGYHAGEHKHEGEPMKLYLSTAEASPFCRVMHSVRLEFSQIHADGDIQASLHLSSGNGSESKSMLVQISFKRDLFGRLYDCYGH
ncbi:unnamed protein product [Darwinula stevensoni]|uniref:Lipase domain-containing protein n=1 Tax=Darwinula stevensoni TaxID=69355 RepID=A0A7R9FT06_9CRUS|nr:unnamed protein product [Darwinula stevensoni]CAG0904675.1 unnamed protein product [Darwinula stevensoni]